MKNHVKYKEDNPKHSFTLVFQAAMLSSTEVPETQGGDAATDEERTRMGFFDRVTSLAPNVDVRHGQGLGSHIIETGEYLGFSYIAGRVNTQYGDRAKWRGHDLTYVGGVVGKVAAVVADVFGYGDGWAHHVNTASNALLGAHFVAKGAEDGLAARGGARRSLPAGGGGAGLPAGAAKTTALGAIPPAPQPGKYLDLDKTAAIAAM